MIPWVPAAVVGEPVPANPSFVDERGRRFTWERLRGTAFAVAFIYTRCREADECPAISIKFARMQERLPEHAQLLEISIDPAYDRPEVLRRYGAAFGEDPSRWTLATGAPDDVLAFARRFGVDVTAGSRPGALEHGEAIAVFDRDERLTWLTAGNTWQPDEIVAALDRAAGQRADPLSLVRLWFENFGNTCGAVLNGSAQAWRRPFAFAIVLAMLVTSITMSLMCLRMLSAKAGPRQS